MPKRYEVIERSFINGRLYEPGETVVLEIDSPGSNLKLAGSKAAQPKDDDQQDAAFVAARGAAGKFVVKDAEGVTVGIFVGNKAEAEAEAARLNAGGVPLLKDDDQQDGGNTGDGNGLPDA
ncbi:hypothetical protein [Pseudomonas sp. GL-R-26]|uniref:hypothetical protein n=1 Tax=Pseudomonas sp. GL-R-26 TaxID=2832392 RepID=UPI001CC0CB13|nr:hypothetical protein [Pseudomonas sp. GL-R-26]